MKILRYIGVIVMIVVFPALSWYYLKSGYSYRVESMESILPKGHVAEWMQTNAIDFQFVSSLKDKTTVIVFKEDASVDSKIVQLHDQFKKSESFQLLILSEHEPADNILALEQALWEIHRHKQSNKFVLVDNTLEVRNAYQNQDDDMKLLVRDVAVVLPRAIERDLKVHKSQEQ